MERRVVWRIVGNGRCVPNEPVIMSVEPAEDAVTQYGEAKDEADEGCAAKRRAEHRCGLVRWSAKEI